MGRRSRKRTAAAIRTTAPDSPPEARGAAPRRRSRRDAAPRPPWGTFPLVELSVLAAIALGVAGLVVGGRAGLILIGGAALLGSVAGLEVSIREHLGGYRSHTLVLSAFVAVAVMAVLYVTGAQRPVLPLVGLAVFAAAALGMRRLYARRSGAITRR